VIGMPAGIRWNHIFGGLMVLFGAFVSSSRILVFLSAHASSAIGQDLEAQVLLGIGVFRVCMVLLGMLTMIFGGIVNSIPRNDNQSIRTASDRTIFHPVLLVILVAAAALRLYGLDYGMWYDEILTYVNYVQLPFADIISTYTTENHHVLFDVLAHLSYVVFGGSNWAVRLPSVLFGVGSLWAVYLLGCEVTSRKESLLATALLAFSYQHIWFSQNARGYMGLLFWTVLSSWFFLRGLREGRPYLWLLYAASAALGVYTHLTMLFVIFGQFLIYLIQLFTRPKATWEGRWHAFFYGFCFAGILTVTLYSIMLPQMMQTIGEESRVATWKSPLWTLMELFQGLKIGFAGTIAAAAALFVLGGGLLSFMKKNLNLVLLFIVPALIGSAAVIASGHPLWPRFFFFTIGYGALIIVRGTVQAGHMIMKPFKLDSGKVELFSYALCIILIAASAVSVPLAYAPKQDFKGALTYINENIEPGDAVVTVGLTTYPYREFFKADWNDVKTVQELNGIRHHSKRTWLLYTIPLHLKFEYPDIMDSINHDFTIVKEFYGTLKGGIIYVCRSDKP